ncbi:MAG: hypothetical protein ABSG61_14295 [Gemmatimonadales bacterium]
MRTSIVLVAVMAAIPAVPLWGQSSDSSVFHRGQWGADFDISGGFVGAGLIHFRSPTQAAVLALSGGVSTAGSGNTSQVNLSLGARRYHAFASQLYFYRTFGIAGSYSHSFAGGGSGTTTNTWGGGLFGELGAGWLVTPHLALGAAWRLSASYEHSSWTAGLFSGSSDGFSVTLGAVRLTGQLYF